MAVEEDNFGREVAVGAPVVEYEAVDPDEQVDRLEAEGGILLEPGGEVGADRLVVATGTVGVER